MGKGENIMLKHLCSQVKSVTHTANKEVSNMSRINNEYARQVKDELTNTAEGKVVTGIVVSSFTLGSLNREGASLAELERRSGIFYNNP